MSETCYHCGDPVINTRYRVDDKLFCCNGCKSVYLLLNENELEDFYALQGQAGKKPTESSAHKYDFLEVPEIRAKYVAFEDAESVHITLFLPQIHCSSCVYLLENLDKIAPGVKSCQTNFASREATIIFNKNEIGLSELAILLERIGYAPNFEDRSKVQKSIDKRFLYKLGVAAFAFGSIMLWTFPEYLGIEEDHAEYRSFMAYLSFAISIPVLVFSANEYLISAFKAIRAKTINIDVPIALGIVALYFQSCVHIFSNQGPGYMDSFAGFIFFLLIGKWFQNRTYQSLAFDRDPRAYFPVAVLRKKAGKEEIVEIEKLDENDEMIVRNEEIIPCDAVLLSDEVTLDYSFVTGESVPVKIQKGNFVYAGGKLMGVRANFKVAKKTQRSRLTELWNSNTQKSEEAETDKLSLYFLIAVLIVAAGAGVYWWIADTSMIFKVVVAVLIVACPCALALSKPFTLGNSVQKMGRNGFYAKNTDVVETIEEITDIVMDKTGTLTKGSYDKVHFDGADLSDEELERVVLVAQSSTHPLSRAICDFFGKKIVVGDDEVQGFEELSGKGVAGTVLGTEIRIGTAKYTGSTESNSGLETVSYLAINGEPKGKFVFESELRPGIGELLQKLGQNRKIHVLSGDSEKDRELIESFVSDHNRVRFNQTPQEKYNYVEELQKQGAKVMMIGDGLNDAGALKIADLGVAVSEDVFQFSPNSDLIVQADQLYRLDRVFALGKYAKTVLAICLGFSVLYNTIGLSFAIVGSLTPLVAAILMPISSVTIVALSTLLIALRKF